MTEPIKLRILKALTTHLEGITPVNGYHVNMTGAVKRGRNVFGASDPVPLISILEAPSPSGTKDADEVIYSESWRLLIQGWVDDDVDNPTDPAYLLMDAVEHRLRRIISLDSMSGAPKYPEEYRLGGLISGLTIPPGVVRPATEGVSSKAFFYIQIAVNVVNSDL